MARKPQGNGTKATDPTREERLKAALKANIARRKAQARARAGEDESPGQETLADDE